MSNCKASGPALIPGTVDTYVCLQNGPGIRQAIKRTTLDANGVRTLVYLEEDGTTAIVNAVETACPPLVLVANPQADIRVASFGRVGDNLVLTQTDGTSWTLPGTFADVNVTSADVVVNADGSATVTLTEDEGGPAVSFTLPASASSVAQPTTPPANAIADDGSVPTRFYNSNALALGDPAGWLLLNVAGIGSVKVPYYTDRGSAPGAGGNQ